MTWKHFIPKLTPQKTRFFSLLRWAGVHLHFKFNSPRFRKPCKCRGIPIAHDLPICGCNDMIWDIHSSASAHQRTSCIGPLPTAVLVAVCSIFMPSVACAARTEPRSRPRQPIVSGPQHLFTLKWAINLGIPPPTWLSLVHRSRWPGSCIDPTT